jgi:DNA transformation protein
MFALVSDSEIFLKCDEASESRFREAGCRPFVYEKNGKPVQMSYWSLPDQALDDRDFLKVWAELALDAAMRARKPATES